MWNPFPDRRRFADRKGHEAANDDSLRGCSSADPVASVADWPERGAGCPSRRGGNRAAAAETGINPRRIKTIALTISGTCAGVAGVLISARLNAANGNFGQFDLLDAIAAVVIGGTALTGGVGSLIGTLFGVLIIVTIRNGLDLLGVSPFWQTSAVGAMILVAAVLHRTASPRRA